MEHLEQILPIFAAFLKVILESISLICILLGLLKAGQLAFFTPRRMRGSSSPMINIRIGFGQWLSLALEFQLAADVVNTTIAPTLDALANLGAIALIRTFLNYFLSKELTEELAITQKSGQVPSLPEDESHATPQ
jgi:uncharacterized membrane protein